jgi:hypothetical protein
VASGRERFHALDVTASWHFVVVEIDPAVDELDRDRVATRGIGGHPGSLAVVGITVQCRKANVGRGFHGGDARSPQVCAR